MAGSTHTARARRAPHPHAAVAALVAGALTFTACSGSGGEPQVLAASGITSAATTAPPIAAPTTTTLPPATRAPDSSSTIAPTTLAATTSSTIAPSTLPRQATTPIAPPLDTRAAEPVIEMGRIAVPEIGIDSVMYEGIRLSTLDYGPGHWPGSALPGQIGNVVVAGHRTSKHKVFRHLDDLAPGDQIVLSDANGEHMYSVTSVEIVGPDAMWIVDPTETPTLTLFACHPPGSTAQRIVVYADLMV